MKFSDKSVGSNIYDILFLCFPIWIPIIFFLGFKSLTTTPAILFLLTLFFLGETHFGATWLFFMDKSNREYITNKPYTFFIFPIIVVIITISVFFLISPAAALVLNSAGSAFHVTRQSIGVNKMFGQRKHPGLLYANLAIYTMSGLFILVGFIRFIMKYNITQEQMRLLQISSLILITSLFISMFIWKKSRELSFKFHLTTLTGMILYLPYLFVPRPEYAVTMGVGMHWLQYLAITIPLYTRKSKILTSENLVKKISKSKIRLCSYLLIYAGSMLIFRQWNQGFTTFSYSNLILIPTTLQMLHFYYDSFIWRFSDPHIRKEIGTYLFSNLGKPDLNIPGVHSKLS